MSKGLCLLHLVSMAPQQQRRSGVPSQCVSMAPQLKTPSEAVHLLKSVGMAPQPQAAQPRPDAGRRKRRRQLLRRRRLRGDAGRRRPGLKRQKGRRQWRLARLPGGRRCRAGMQLFWGKGGSSISGVLGTAKCIFSLCLVLHEMSQVMHAAAWVHAQDCACKSAVWSRIAG